MKESIASAAFESDGQKKNSCYYSLAILIAGKLC